jgi:hypothetical protein
MQELGDWLGRVEAPAELREQVFGRRFAPINTGNTAGRNRRSPAILGGLIAAAAFAVLAVTIGRGLPTRDLQSNDPAQIRAWVHGKTGIGIPLPEKLSPSIRLVSASRPSKGTAQIAYQVNGQEVILLASMASAAVAGDGRHRFLNRDAHSASWTMRGVVYTVVCPTGEVAQVACQLCHSL